MRETLETAPDLGPAARYVHVHPELKASPETLTLGQRLADWVAALVGSWTFIIVQSALLVAWMAVNAWLAWHATHGGLQAWDPYPFILLNLVLSFQAAYTGPVVMMSQNRQAEKDRQTAEHDLHVDSLAEKEIRIVMDHLVHQDKLLLRAIDTLEKLETRAGSDELTRRLDELFKRMEAADEHIIARMEQLESQHVAATKQAPENRPGG